MHMISYEKHQGLWGTNYEETEISPSERNACNNRYDPMHIFFRGPRKPVQFVSQQLDWPCVLLGPSLPEE